MLSAAIMGYLLAISVALAGTLGARMQDSGELAEAYQARPAAVLALTIPYSVSGLAALVYFSWAYLDLYQIVTFIAALILLTSWDTAKTPASTRWSLFIGAVVLTVLTELGLLAQA